MKKISINKIAELAGVSKTTVSFVLNGRGDEKKISTDTQKNIIDIADKNNYKANYIARSLSIGKSDTIGFVVPDISNPFYGKIARYVELYAEKKGYFVMVASTGEEIEKEIKLLEGLKARQIDGVILASSAKSYKQIDSLTDNGFPIVFFDRVFNNITESFVDINNSNSTQELTQLLIQKGHSRIGFISLTSYLPNIEQRILGFKSALKENNIELKPELIIEINHHKIKQEIKAALDQFLLCDQPITAIVFINNVLAAEGIWAINTYYPNLANKLLFASFDNLDLFDYSKPKVISALQPANEIAKNCVDMLCKNIENSEKLNGIQLNTKIINR